MFGKLFQWLKLPVTEVPDDIAVCEFECGETECRMGEWKLCERRLQAVASYRRDSRTHQG